MSRIEKYIETADVMNMAYVIISCLMKVSLSVCTLNSRNKIEPVIWLGNDKMNFVTKYKYLGHIINCDLTDDNDVHVKHSMPELTCL